MPADSRDRRTIAAVACPTCGAAVGQPCRNPVQHQQWRGPEDHRQQPVRCHSERRAAWLEHKRQREAT